MNWVLWIRSIRPLVSFFSGILVVAGFRTFGKPGPEAWLLAGTVFSICAVTMLQNDWRDRWHDAQKGKTLARDSSRVFLVWTGVWWIVSLVSVGFSSAMSRSAFPLLFGLLVTAGIYSEMRSVPFLPIMLTSVASASPLLLPIVTGKSSTLLWHLFFGAATLIFSREILKDIEDAAVDPGYKWTIPVAFGERSARILASMCIVTAFAILLPITSWHLTAILFSIVAIRAEGKRPITAAKWLLTIAMGAIMAEMLLF